MSFLDYNPQELSPQYLEDLATGYRFSEVLFTAVEMEIFTFLEPNGMNGVQLGEALAVLDLNLESDPCGALKEIFTA
ncbi:MAG: hypothetical protein DDT30_01690 [Dehalococcoidia bacterium]|nr:hypothetical protein [Bacillota bacterium]MBT9141701.1 hypothetical protein [Bacillota bacterium]